MGRILVIDDDEGIRESFQEVLETVGHMVFTAHDGRTGIESARLVRPDLIFLDLKMPGLTGAETLATLHMSCPGIPVYVVTAFYGEYVAALRELESHGVDFNLARKPLTAAEIKMIAASRLSPRRAHP